MRSTIFAVCLCMIPANLSPPSPLLAGPPSKPDKKSPSSDFIRIGKPLPRLGLHSATHGPDQNLADPTGRKTLLVFFNTDAESDRKRLIEINRAAQHFLADKRLAILGIIEEPTPGRALLFTRWKKLDWSLLHDPLNLAETVKLPLVIALDEFGVVRAVNPKLDSLEKDFVARKFKKPRGNSESSDVLPDPRVTRRMAREARTAANYRAHGDALVLAGAPGQIDEAVKAYQDALKAHDAKDDPLASYRLGVAALLRLVTERRQTGDFSLALDSWSAARRLQPENETLNSTLSRFAPSPHAARPAWVTLAINGSPDRAKTLLATDSAPWTPDISTAHRKPDTTDSIPSVPNDAGIDAAPLVSIDYGVVGGLTPRTFDEAAVNICLVPSIDRGVAWVHGRPIRIWLTDLPEGVTTQARYLEMTPIDAGSSPTPPVLLRFDVTMAGKKTPTQPLRFATVYEIAEGASPARILRQDLQISLAP